MHVVSSRTVDLTTLFSHKVARPSYSDRHRSASNRAESTNLGPSNPGVGPSAVDKNEPDLGSVVYSGAKLILNGVKESADFFGPLKSVAGGLCFILDNCEVRHFL